MAEETYTESGVVLTLDQLIRYHNLRNDYHRDVQKAAQAYQREREALLASLVDVELTADERAKIEAANAVLIAKSPAAKKLKNLLKAASKPKPEDVLPVEEPA